MLAGYDLNEKRQRNIDTIQQNLPPFLFLRSLVDAVYALKDEVHELKKVNMLKCRNLIFRCQ